MLHAEHTTEDSDKWFELLPHALDPINEPSNITLRKGRSAPNELDHRTWPIMTVSE